MTELQRLRDERCKIVLSFGAGVQSSALLLMSCKGLLPKIDVAIFADTGWEPAAVYAHLEWCENEAAKAGIPVVRVRHNELGLRNTVIRAVNDPKVRFAAVPLYVMAGGKREGMGRRQCTYDFKVEPIETYIRREILGLRPRQHAPKEECVEQWMGITVDEIQRAKPSRLPWKYHAFPFVGIRCDYLGMTWNRQACLNWLEKHYPDITTPRSACIGCPYRSDREWELIRQVPEEWQNAVEFDHAVRWGGKFRQYLHSSCVPLDQVNLNGGGDQPGLWDAECEGMCGL